MPTLTVPYSSGSQKRSSASWTRPPTLTVTSSDSESGSDPSSVHSKSEPEPETKNTGTDGPTLGPRGHRLAQTIPSRASRLVHPPTIPAFSQISISFSTLSFTRSSSRSKASPESTLLSASPSTPAVLCFPSRFEAAKSGNQLETPNHSTSSSHFLRAPSPCPPSDTTVFNSNNRAEASLKSRIRANTISTSSTPGPLPAPRRSAFTTTAAFFTSMSRPSWDPFPLMTSTSHSHSHTHPPGLTNSASVSPSTTTAPVTIISNPNSISIEDARLLDPSYLSSIPSHHVSGNMGCNSGGGTAYSHAIPYVDPQGTLHDPDYRPFPLIRQTKKSTPSPFAIRKPYWEVEEDAEFESDDGDDDEGSTPSTPTSTTPFICYFLESHPLKRGAPLRNGSSLPSTSKTFGSSQDTVYGRGNNKRGIGLGARKRSQLKLGTAYMYATIATGLGSLSQGYGQSPTTPTRTSTPIPVPQYTSTLSTSPPTMEEAHPGKEKKGWGGLLWKSGRKEGDRD